jgi:hypothetical protein
VKNILYHCVKQALATLRRGEEEEEEEEQEEDDDDRS